MRTRKYRRHKKNKSIKRGGSLSGAVGEGVNIVKNKAIDAALGTVGLQRIKKQDDLENNKNITDGIINEGADIINSTAENPETKENFERAVKNGAILADIVIDASKEPLQRVIDVGKEEIPKVIGAAGSGAIKVVTDVAGAVPFLGAVIDLGKAANDSMGAISKAVRSGTKIVNTTSEAIEEASDIFKNGLNKLKEQSNRTYRRADRSINEFEDPINSLKGGKRNITCRRKI